MEHLPQNSAFRVPRSPDNSSPTQYSGHSTPTHYQGHSAPNQYGLPRKINSNSASPSPSPTPRLFKRKELSPEQVFGFEDRTVKYLAEEKYDQAFTSMRKKMELGMELTYARDLMTFHKIALLSRNSEKAARIRDELNDIIDKELPDVDADQLQAMADRFRDDEKYAEAMLFYRIAADIFEADYDAREAASGIANCCSGLRNAIKGFYKQTEHDNRSLIQHHVVPLMRDLKTMLRDIKGIDNSFRTYCEAHCLHCIEYIEGHIKDYESCELTLVEAINLIETRLVDKYKKNRVYATLLHNLGYIYEVTGRLDAALKLYHKAVLADKNAVDYRDENERRQNMHAGEVSIRRIGQKKRKDGDAEMNVSEVDTNRTNPRDF